MKIMTLRFLNVLLDVVAKAAAQSLTEEQAAEGLASADDLLARLKQWRWERWDPQTATVLQLLPREVLSTILGQLEDRRDLAHLAATCCLLWCDAPAAPVRLVGPVEAELRRRAEARSLDVGYSLPDGAASWVPYLLQRELRDAQRRRAPLAAGMLYSVFVDVNGRLHTCGQAGGHGPALGHTGVDAIGPPTLVPSMLDRRIVSVASSIFHCLALSAEGEVFSWGAGDQGALGHGDENHRAVPSRIESLQRIESIMAGNGRSAAVDERGHLFTCGLARTIPGEEAWPTGLGYAVDLQTESQLTPKRVDALSQHRVVGVALGSFFTLAVTDAGAVFSFGSGTLGVLGHGSLNSEMLPRRIDALTQTGRRFVAVAAGGCHALALTEEGQLYCWGWGGANGYRQGANYDTHTRLTPGLLTALLGERVAFVDAKAVSSYAVTEKGELYTWGDRNCHHFGHGEVDEGQAAPRRVEMPGGVQVAAVALGVAHMLVADADGGAWACGTRRALGLYSPDAWEVDGVREPTRIPNLRVRRGLTRVRLLAG